MTAIDFLLSAKYNINEVMLMLREMLGNATGKKKGVIIGLLSFTAVFLLAALSCLVLFLIDFLIPDRSDDGLNDISFATPDYTYDISLDDEYMAEDRRVWVNDGVLSAPIDDEDYSDNQLYIFFAKYFTALQTGDAASLKSCYSDELVSTLKLPNKLSMQRVYDIMLYYRSGESKTDPSGIIYTEYVYRFEYKIMKNDGVFRRDLESDAIRPQIVTVRVYFDDIYISDVISNFRK